MPKPWNKAADENLFNEEFMRGFRNNLPFDLSKNAMRDLRINLLKFLQDLKTKGFVLGFAK